MARQRKSANTRATNRPPANSWFSHNRAVIRFGLTFSFVTLLYYVVALLPWVKGELFPAYLRANAQASCTILNFLGQSCRVVDTTIRSPQFAITIKRGCDALEPSWLFCAAVLAFPASWPRRLLGMVGGVAAILALNLIRIVSLYFFGLHLPGIFETMHLEVWPVIFILVAFLLWIEWIARSRYNKLASPNATA